MFVKMREDHCDQRVGIVHVRLDEIFFVVEK